MSLNGVHYFKYFAKQAFCEKRYESGINAEKKVLPILQKILGKDTHKTDIHHPLDFYCPSKKTWLELKQRNHYRNKYPTSIVPSSKIAFAKSVLEKGDKVVFLFLFEDGLFKYEYTGQELVEDYTGIHDKTLHSHFPVCDLVKVCEL